MKTIRVVMIVLMTLIQAGMASADSRTASVRVSCSIAPSIGISSKATFTPQERQMLGLSGQSSLMHVHSNLGKNYDVAESWQARGSERLKILTLTAR